MTEIDDEIRADALARLKKRRDFGGHLLVYVLFNVAVWVVWAFTGSGHPWPVFITVFWGIGVVMNAWDAFWRRPITEADVRREAERLRREHPAV